LKITFLGTGTSQGVPVIGCQCPVCHSLDFRDRRLRTSAHLEVDGQSLIIDSGPDFRQQVLANRITRLDGLLFTHQHKDHVAGMDDVRSFNFLQKKAMPIYARAAVVDQLKQEFAYVFAKDKYPGVPQIEVHLIDNAPFDAQGVPVIPLEVMHYKMPVFGFRVRDFTYITDAKTINEAEKNKIRGTRVLVLNALQHKQHISHFTLEEALAIVEELQPEQTYLTHISHNLGLHRDVELTLPPHVKLAYDGLTIEL
jgi:phosphoribosyl 1,2-cyclic phosphate phosphodiesterase